jgi:hypothetical protein
MAKNTDSGLLLTIGLVCAFLALVSVKFTRPEGPRHKSTPQAVEIENPVAPSDTTTGVSVR